MHENRCHVFTFGRCRHSFRAPHEAMASLSGLTIAALPVSRNDTGWGPTRFPEEFVGIPYEDFNKGARSGAWLTSPCNSSAGPRERLRQDTLLRPLRRRRSLTLWIRPSRRNRSAWEQAWGGRNKQGGVREAREERTRSADGVNQGRTGGT